MIGVTFILLFLMSGKVSWYVDTTVLITRIVLALVTALFIKNGKPKTIIISGLGIIVGGFLMFLWGFLIEGGL
jgi:hypothetical protein